MKDNNGYAVGLTISQMVLATQNLLGLDETEAVVLVGTQVPFDVRLVIDHPQSEPAQYKYGTLTLNGIRFAHNPGLKGDY